MATKIAINGFGRIGRCIVRAIAERQVKDLEIVAINDLTDAKTLAHLYNFDSVHGRASHPATALEGAIAFGASTPTKITAEKEPGKLPWKALEVDVVLECTGLFTDREKAKAHLEAGAKKVIISAPAKGQDATIVLGVNTGVYDAAKHTIISCGSCTTNCLAPVAKVLLDAFGLQRGLMTTIHSYTNDQAILDIPHRKGDLRRARAAALNMIPTSTGAAKALAEVIPELKGKFDGQSVRVPTMDVSLVDLTFETEKPLTRDAIHAAMKAAAEGPMKGILEYEQRELVSLDFLGNPHSSIFDATITQVMGDKFAKVFSWYDNEWGFSNRMVDLTQLVGSKL
jgi:glyceraldehyde 3-phosphate dehydrogenase